MKKYKKKLFIVFVLERLLTYLVNRYMPHLNQLLIQLAAVISAVTIDTMRLRLERVNLETNCVSGSIK